MISDAKLAELEKKAGEIRQDIIKTLLEAGSGHSAGPLGMADVFTSLYFNVLNHNPKKPEWEDRDRFVLSAGHICPVWYVTLAHSGYFPKSELKTLRKLNTRLQGHPHNLEMPAIENSSGPLGQGLSQGVGMALAARLNEKNYEVFVIGSDGETQEGQTWEAVMFAGRNRVNNLTYIIDRNNIQIDGFVDEVLDIEPLVQKFTAFNWHAQAVDGHNIRDVINACGMAKSVHDKPSVIIAHTIPGKGVSFMENRYEWHGKPPSEEEAKIALRDLRTLEGKIRSEHE